MALDPAVAALAGAGIGALSTTVPAYLEHKRLRAGDKREQARRAAADAAADEAWLENALSECIDTVARFLAEAEGRQTSDNLERAREARELMVATWVKTLLVVRGSPYEPAMKRMARTVGVADPSIRPHDLIPAAREARDALVEVIAPPDFSPAPIPT